MADMELTAVLSGLAELLPIVPPVDVRLAAPVELSVPAPDILAVASNVAPPLAVRLALRLMLVPAVRLAVPLPMVTLLANVMLCPELPVKLPPTLFKVNCAAALPYVKPVPGVLSVVVIVTLPALLALPEELRITFGVNP